MAGQRPIFTEIRLDGVSSFRCYNITMNVTTPSKAFPAPEHDHELCLDQAMARARSAFAAKGLRLTPLREAVFQEIAAASHRAIGAYEVLERMAARGERLAPISVYRAIDALVAAGIVHRFESRNAFFACHTGHEQRQLVLACETCGSVAEVDGARVFAAIDKTAEGASFAASAKGAVVEVWGLCAHCTGKDAGDARS
jgi:Fur family transcriptional regulator, zinc uptake regulator